MSENQNIAVLLIAAYNREGYIGKDGDLLYRIGDDLRRFSRLTADSVLIMGRKTYESLPKTLSNRLHIVVTSKPHKDIKHPDNPTGELIAYKPTVLDAYRLAEIKAKSLDGSRICFIGGAEIYRECLPYINQAHITRVWDNAEGDARFPIDDFERLTRRSFVLAESSSKTCNETGLEYGFETYHHNAIALEGVNTYMEPIGERGLILMRDDTSEYRVRRDSLEMYSPHRESPVIEVSTENRKLALRYENTDRQKAALKQLDDIFRAA